MLNPAISIIVPVFNAAQYLQECLDSILSQSFNDFELILIDDGSTDNSLSICQSYERRDSRIKIISGPNQGVSAARNKGLNVACGEWITFVDPDDWVEPTHVSTLYNAQKKNRDMDIFLFDYNYGIDNIHLKLNTSPFTLI